jgi:sugar (pentulose or hexulose) kinase
MFVGALDQGTTSTRFMVFDAAGQEVARRQIEHQQILPGPGWVEHDPIEIAARVDEVIAGALRTAGLTGRDLAAIGITNQRETTGRLGSEDRPSVAQRHRLAGHANGRTRRDVRAAARTAHRRRPGFHRPPTSRP